MNISGLDPNGELGRLFFQVQSKNASDADQRPSTVNGSFSTTDAVALSGFAEEVRGISRTVADQPDVRQDRVAAVREALDQNRQLANSRQVADALVRETILGALTFSS